MQNIKSSVVSALKTATALYTLISDRIYFHYPDSFNTLPCVSYFEFNNSGSLYSDDDESASEIIFQIDVWNNNSTSTIAQAIDTVMKSLDFVRIESRDKFESETKIHQKTMKFKIDYMDPS